jgi:hypothetical protein
MPTQIRTPTGPKPVSKNRRVEFFSPHGSFLQFLPRAMDLNPQTPIASLSLGKRSRISLHIVRAGGKA